MSSLNSPNLVALRNAFAKSIACKIDVLNSTELSIFEARRIKESISSDIRKYTDLVTPQQSKAAKNTADKLNVNLPEMRWHDQSKFDAGRKIFHLEHVFPVRHIRDLCLKARIADKISDALYAKTKVAWILKSEDKTLTSLGYRSVRLNPKAAYKEAGIELV